ncbi:MAG TPA: OB-fold domain-containing protein [Acidimicrobiales bacterium]|nr:OB-fold domain-containing protein [Acidimicrobiales bacterium]
MAEATWKLEFPYRRSVGPVIGAFLTGLREGKVVGIKTAAGRVICPPLEYDPETGEGLGAEALVDLADTGVVTDWSWVPAPHDKQPAQPFAWALVKIDGADTALLHVVNGEVERGTKVRAVWRDERRGHVTDIEHFEVIA